MEGQVYIEGLREFRRDLRRMDPALVEGVRDALKEAAEIVAVDARRRVAPYSRSGATVKTTKSFTSGDRAGVRTTAVRRSRRYPGGYRYPRRYEFGDRNRPFLQPALEAKRDEVIERLERALDDVARIWEG